MEMHFKSLNTRDNIFEKLSPSVNDLSKILTNKRKNIVPKNPLSTDKKLSEIIRKEYIENI